jgi:hypothetical protein
MHVATLLPPSLLFLFIIIIALAACALFLLVVLGCCWAAGRVGAAKTSQKVCRPIERTRQL